MAGPSRGKRLNEPVSSDVPGENAVKSASRLGRKGWAMVMLTIGVGVLGGLGLFTFGYGQGASYLSNDPKGCVNCHVMQGHFDSWEQSSHHHVAVCNDCHLPHHPIGKWVTKADNGFFHSLAFTLENFHEPIHIKPRNARVAQNACLDCHAEIVHQMLSEDPEEEAPACVHCHKDVGHAHRR